MTEYTYHGGVRNDTPSDPPLLEIYSTASIEVYISQDAKRLWVNLNGICVLRASRIRELWLWNDANPGGSANGRVTPYQENPDAK